MSKPTIFFKLAYGATKTGIIHLKLYYDVVPKTCENFRALATHEKGYGYRNSVFHRIIPNFMAQGGDITRFDGTGGKSIYGSAFADENFKLEHTKPYLLSMANCGPNTNSSQFFITYAACKWLDGKHVVFGEVIEGKEVMKEVEKLGTKEGRVKEKVTVVDCGVL
jgi:cyclophilin family peptidyl-prolyl cis-trans isomerase